MKLINSKRVAELTGLSQSTINTYATKRNNTFPEPKGFTNGESYKLANGWSEREVLDWINARPVDPFNIDDVRKLANRGLTKPEIAKRLNVSYDRVLKAAKKHNIKTARCRKSSERAKTIINAVRNNAAHQRFTMIFREFKRVNQCLS